MRPVPTEGPVLRLHEGVLLLGKRSERQVHVRVNWQETEEEGQCVVMAYDPSECKRRSEFGVRVESGAKRKAPVTSPGHVQESGRALEFQRA